MVDGGVGRAILVVMDDAVLVELPDEDVEDADDGVIGDDADI